MTDNVEILPRKRDTKYQPWMCDKIVEVARQGGHVAKMCSEIGIRSRDTFYRWLDEYDEFREAYEYAKLESKAFYEEVLLAGALGKIKGFNFNSVAMVMNNKFSDEYKRSANSSNTEINIGSINSIEKLDEKALDAKIEQLQHKLGLLESDSEGSEQDKT